MRLPTTAKKKRKKRKKEEEINSKRNYINTWRLNKVLFCGTGV
jgi:hypothetical protein